MEPAYQDHLPEDRRYTVEHVWALPDGAEAVCGITAYAQEQLGEVVYVGLPEPGVRFAAGECFGTVESMKSASELYMPVTGEIASVNRSLEDQPDLVNAEPYGGGWIVRVRPDSPEDARSDLLLSAEGYRLLLRSLREAG